MSVLAGLRPERVFYYFEELCRIPHGSGNTKEVSDYLVQFARDHELSWYQDASNNVIIRRPASKGCELAPTVILQGHCDMVCEKKPGSSHDFTKDGLELHIDGDEIYARDTTLGGDDGIAVAYMLAVLESDDLQLPAIEALITTDEEIGLLGAAALNGNELKGRTLLNMDSEEEGILTVSCAGGMTAMMDLPVRRSEVMGEQMEVTISGLAGGHSGTEIHKNRANSNILAGRFLYELAGKMDYALIELEASRFTENLRREYSGTDDGITVTVEKTGEGAAPALHPVSLQKTVFFLMNLPNGVQKMSGQIPGLVETSLNLGILKLEPDHLHACASVRSSVGSAKEALSDKLEYLIGFLGGEFHVEGAYPAWEYKEDSALRDLMVAEYEAMYGQKPAVEAIHAGLECGLFYEKLSGLDCVSFGPNMKAIHTTEERLSISSVERTYQYLCRVLEQLSKRQA